MDTFDVKSLRTSLSQPTLRSLLSKLGCDDCVVSVYDQVGSTNDVAVAALGSNSQAWHLICANEQVAGRGRLGRTWHSPWGSSVCVSVAVPQEFCDSSHGLFSLAAGLAMVDALLDVGVETRVKWPNDIVVDLSSDRNLFKLGGVLTQITNSGVIIGVGVNINLVQEDLPITQSTSTFLMGHLVQREDIIARFLFHLRARLHQSCADFMTDYRAMCITISQRVRVELLGGQDLEGTCTGITDSGHLEVLGNEKVHIIAAGDVHHVRNS